MPARGAWGAVRALGPALERGCPRRRRASLRACMALCPVLPGTPGVG